MSERTQPLWLVALLAGAVMLIDGYDLQAMSIALPPLAKSWGKLSTDFDWVLSAAVLGLGVASAFVAPLGDRHGRRPFVLASFALVTLSVMGTAIAGSLWQLAFWRLLTGAGLGAALPNVSALVAELAPAKSRAGILTLIGLGIALGAMGSGFLVPPLVARFGWPGPFWLSAAVSLAILLALLVLLPESPAHRAGIRLTEGSLRTIIGPDYLGRTALLWLMFIFNAFLLYLMTSWLPTLLTREGWTLAAAGGAIGYMQIGGLAGGLAIAMLMDRWRPSLALLCGYGLAAVGLLLFSVVPQTTLYWSLLIALIGVGISGVYMTLNAVAAAIYPAAILSAGIGFTVAVARLGALSAPPLGAQLIRGGVSAPTFMALLLVPLAASAVAVLALRLRRGGEAA